MSAWIIRSGKGGTRANEWIEGNYIAIYWNLNGVDISSLSRAQIKSIYKAQNGYASAQMIASSAGMIYRFAHELKIGSTVVMYDPSDRLYHLGEITGNCEYISLSNVDDTGFYKRDVQWGMTASRDLLSSRAKHSLGSISTLFTVSKEALHELKNAATQKESLNHLDSEYESNSDIRDATTEDGIERIKDRIIQLT